MQIPTGTNVYSYFELFRWLAVIKLFEGTRGNITYGGVVTGNDAPLLLVFLFLSFYVSFPIQKVPERLAQNPFMNILRALQEKFGNFFSIVIKHMIIFVKFVTNLEMYIEGTRHLLQIYSWWITNIQHKHTISASWFR